jgi:hypothetical protein
VVKQHQRARGKAPKWNMSQSGWQSVAIYDGQLPSIELRLLSAQSPGRDKRTQQQEYASCQHRNRLRQSRLADKIAAVFD